MTQAILPELPSGVIVQAGPWSGGPSSSPAAPPERTAPAAPADAASAVSRLVARAAACGDLKSAAAVLAEGLQSLARCGQVALGRKGRILALSGASRLDRKSELAAALETVLAETTRPVEQAAGSPISSIDQSAGLREAPLPCPTGKPVTAAEKRLCTLSGTSTIAAFAICDLRGEAVAACVCLGLEQGEAPTRAARLFQTAEGQLAACLHLVGGHGAGWLRRTVRRVTHSRRRTLATVAAAAVLIVAVLAVPVPYKVSGHAVVEPVVRRYVAAPYDGRLEEALVEPGDLVTRGQVLARMDGREIRWELAGLTADRDGALKRRDAGLAAHETSAAQLAALEGRRLDLKIRLLEHRLETLELASPIDGIVIHGDHKKAEGARLKMGQTLFEVAPLDRMVIEVAVPDEEISRVTLGQEVTIHLDAYPTVTPTGTLTKIHPRAEVRDTENVFVGEVLCDNPQAILRPGMKGKAKITTARHPLGWNLFHKPWERLVLLFGR